MINWESFKDDFERRSVEMDLDVKFDQIDDVTLEVLLIDEDGFNIGEGKIAHIGKFKETPVFEVNTAFAKALVSTSHAAFGVFYV